MKLKKEYRSYIWSLITLILSVAIIFISNLISGSLLNISALSENFPEEFSLELSDVSEIISSSIGQTDNPVYFPSGSGSSELYNIEKLSDSDPMFESVVPRFLDNVSIAMYHLFDFYSYEDATNMHQKCTLWGVYSKETNNRVDTMVSLNIILLNNNTLWSVTAYGNDKAITHLERSLYYSPDITDREVLSNSLKGITQEGAVEKFASNIIILSDSFGLPEIKKDIDIKNNTRYYFNELELEYSLKEFDAAANIYEIFYKDLNMKFDISVSHSNELLAVTRVK